jgi:hypothetical protein
MTMILQAVGCIGGLILLTFIIEYLMRDKQENIPYSRGYIGIPKEEE